MSLPGPQGDKSFVLSVDFLLNVMVYLLIADWKNDSFLCFEFVWMRTVCTGTGCGRLEAVAAGV